MTVLERLVARRAEIFTRIDEVRVATETGDGRDMTDEERAEIRAFRDELAQIEERVEELRDIEARRQAATAADPTPPAERAPAVVTNEARVYSPDSQRRGVSFIRDVVNAMSDPSAAARIQRHMQESRVDGEIPERRDIGTGAFAGLTVPQFLTDLVAPRARAMRPFANVCRGMTLPDDGMTVEISRVTTGSTAASQAAQNDAVSEQDIDDTQLTVDVRTIAGQQDVSRQVIDRSTGAEQVVIEDLVRAYHTELDRQLLVGSGASGQHRGVQNVASNNAVTYTDASPTAAELYPKLADLIQQCQSDVFMGLTHFLMHPRRWWWLASQVGTSFPFLTVPAAGAQQGGVVGNTDYDMNNRSILGVPVVLDGNIPTNLGAGTDEDIIFGVTDFECFLWEQPNSPLFIRAEQTAAGNLTVKLVVYGYSAFTAGRYPDSNGDITGTGLITPTF